MKVFLGTVALEKNRWSSRVPSLKVSDYITSIKSDGFSGMELWQEHYTGADDAEKQLISSSAQCVIFNTYCKFHQGLTADMCEVAKAVADSGAVAIKYNFGNDMATVNEEYKTFMQWVALLPQNIELMCECHAGTLMHDVKFAREFFADKDTRWTAIAHLCEDEQRRADIISAYGDRIVHIHTQMRDSSNHFMQLCDDAKRASADIKKALLLPNLRSFTVEFTADADTPEGLYNNAVKDLEFIRKNS